MLQKILRSRIARVPARVLEAIYFISAALLVFVLPYYVPMKHVVFSPSYDFGFNNQVAVAGTLFCVVVAPLFLSRDSEWFPAIISAGEQPAPRRRLLYRMAALHTIGIAFYFWSTTLIGNTPDGSYFLRNAINMARGLRPYQDFEFAYGPGLLYPTHWLNALGLSVHSAYFLFYLAITYVGLYMAWSFPNQLPVQTGTKALVFVLISSISIVSLLTVGVSYTIVRFVTPLWILGKLNAAYVGSRPVWVQAAIGGVGVLLTDLVSPEIGTVYAVSAATFFGFTCLRDAENRIWRGFAVLLCVGVHGLFLFTLMPPQYRDSMVAFSHGGNNFPVVPSILDIFYLVGAMYCFRRYRPDLSQRNLVFPLILLYGLGSIPGALTHTDSGHVAWDGIAIFVLLIVAAEGSKKLLGRSLALLPAVFFASSTPYLLTPVAILVAAILPGFRIPRVPASPASLEKHVAAASSFSSSAMLSTEYQLEERLAKVNLKPQYYFGLTNVFDSNAVSRALYDLKHADAAVLVTGRPTLDTGCPTEAAERSMLRWWLLYPYGVRRKHNSCEMYAPYYAYVYAEYRPMPGYPEFWIKKRIYAGTENGGRTGIGPPSP